MYLHPFKNQYRDQDFTLIADTIKEYFPVNKPKRLTAKTVASSPGFKKIGKIVNEEFLNKKAYSEKWGKLISNLRKVFKKPVHGHPDLSGGGFFGELIIEEAKTPDFIWQKALKFYVSVLGPFFAIHGVDGSIALVEIESRVPEFNKGNFAATNAITISPVFEYKDVFHKLEDGLRAFLPGYLFVPYIGNNLNSGSREYCFMQYLLALLRSFLRKVERFEIRVITSVTTHQMVPVISLTVLTRLSALYSLFLLLLPYKHYFVVKITSAFRADGVDSTIRVVSVLKSAIAVRIFINLFSDTVWKYNNRIR